MAVHVFRHALWEGNVGRKCGRAPMKTAMRTTPTATQTMTMMRVVLSLELFDLVPLLVAVSL